MELGKDIIQKIRSAVKSKLLDLGSYVDDELPDYVMVMVANKKTEAQMTEDLSLFLGQKTSKFTCWLHSLLEKLTSISAERVDLKNSTRSKKLVGKSSESKLLQSPSPNHVEESSNKTARVTTNSEVFEPEISLKSECDYIDDIDRDDDDDDASLETLKRPMQVMSQDSSTSKVEKTRISRKRPRDILTKKQKNHLQSEMKSGKIVDQKSINVECSQMQLALHKPPFKQIQTHETFQKSENKEIRSDGYQEEVTNSGCTHDQSSRLVQAKEAPVTSIKCEDSNADLVSAGEISGEEQFYPYEISGDVEMISQDEFNFEEVKVKHSDFGELKTEAEKESERLNGEAAKMRKILVSERNISTKPERKVSVMNLSGNNQSFTDLPSSMYHHVTDQAPNVTNFIVTLNGAFDHLGDCILDDNLEDYEDEERDLLQTQHDWSPMNSRGCSLGSQSLIICDEDEEDSDDHQTKRHKISGRCRYWPKCKVGDACPYHHPYKPCKAFPNCRYKDKCLFIHPECKFNSSCTNISCPYTHTGSRALLTAAPTVILQPIKVPIMRSGHMSGRTRKPLPKAAVPPSKIQCRFFPNCADLNCPYSHPKPCRYGLSCSAKNRCPYSHPLLPSKDKLKWFAKIEDEKDSL